ncbi:MAG: hypothetical protein GC156_13525 [Actinomycetales bacterium]|nr:hypothetical protein [Actinomycetales bacterium]
MSAAVSDPGSLATLERRMGSYADAMQQQAGRVRVTIGQVVVAQLLPGALVTGGSGMKIRLGLGFSRDSTGLDVACRDAQDVLADALRAALAAGWGPFTGQLLAKAPRPRDGVPSSYVMQPYAVKLAAYGRPFSTVVLEVGYDELGATSDGSGEFLLPDQIVDLFAALGLPRPQPVPILAVHHQIAQKIHACTEPGSERAHDLVDLQLLWSTNEAGVELVSVTTERLFDFRRAHAFPGRCTVGPDWPTAYAEAATDLDVIPDVAAAAAWLNARLADLARRAR